MAVSKDCPKCGTVNPSEAQRCDCGYDFITGTMSEAETPGTSRGFGGIDAMRAFVMLVTLAVVGVSYWFVLPAIQSLIIPSAPGGRDGPWVLRPILALRFGAVAVMAAVTLPLITRPLWWIWKRQDAALGTRYVPFRNRPGKRVGLVFKGCLLLVVYASALFFYLFSWEIIGPDGIEQRLPWTTLHHSYRDIVSLETIREGERSEAISKDGPWYSVTLKSGRSITFSEDNEGCTRGELRAMAAYIAERSGLTWTPRSDMRPR